MVTGYASACLVAVCKRCRSSTAHVEVSAERVHVVSDRSSCARAVDARSFSISRSRRQTRPSPVGGVWLSVTTQRARPQVFALQLERACCDFYSGARHRWWPRSRHHRRMRAVDACAASATPASSRAFFATRRVSSDRSSRARETCRWRPSSDHFSNFERNVPALLLHTTAVQPRSRCVMSLLNLSALFWSHSPGASNTSTVVSSGSRPT
jgi:hypothetical protein